MTRDELEKKAWEKIPARFRTTVNGQQAVLPPKPGMGPGPVIFSSFPDKLLLKWAGLPATVPVTEGTAARHAKRIVEALLTERHFVATVTGKGGYYKWHAVRDDGMGFGSSFTYTTAGEAERSAQKNLGKMGSVVVKHVQESKDLVHHTGPLPPGGLVSGKCKNCKTPFTVSGKAIQHDGSIICPKCKKNADVVESVTESLLEEEPFQLKIKCESFGKTLSGKYGNQGSYTGSFTAAQFIQRLKNSFPIDREGQPVHYQFTSLDGHQGIVDHLVAEHLPKTGKQPGGSAYR